MLGPLNEEFANFFPYDAFGQAIVPAYTLSACSSLYTTSYTQKHFLNYGSGKSFPVYWHKNNPEWIKASLHLDTTPLVWENDLSAELNKLNIQISSYQLQKFRDYHKIKLFKTKKYFKTRGNLRFIMKLHKRILKNTIKNPSYDISGPTNA